MTDRTIEAREELEVKLVYQGARAYRSLLAGQDARPEDKGLTSADQRMEVLAELLDCIGIQEVGPELPFEIIAWAIETGQVALYEDLACEAMLVGLAESGYVPARFLVAKMELVGVPFGSSQRIVHEESGESLDVAEASRMFLRDLATDGYADAATEYALCTWNESREKSRTLLQRLAPAYPEAQLRLGLLMLGDDPEAAALLIDEAEERIANRGYSYLGKLDKDLKRFKRI